MIFKKIFLFHYKWNLYQCNFILVWQTKELFLVCPPSPSRRVLIHNKNKNNSHSSLQERYRCLLLALLPYHRGNEISVFARIIFSHFPLSLFTYESHLRVYITTSKNFLISFLQMLYEGRDKNSLITVIWVYKLISKIYLFSKFTCCEFHWQEVRTLKIFVL